MSKLSLVFYSDLTWRERVCHLPHWYISLIRLRWLHRHHLNVWLAGRSENFDQWRIEACVRPWGQRLGKSCLIIVFSKCLLALVRHPIWLVHHTWRLTAVIPFRLFVNNFSSSVWESTTGLFCAHNYSRGLLHCIWWYYFGLFGDIRTRVQLDMATLCLFLSSLGADFPLYRLSIFLRLIGLHFVLFSFLLYFLWCIRNLFVTV